MENHSKRQNGQPGDSRVKIGKRRDWTSLERMKLSCNTKKKKLTINLVSILLSTQKLLFSLSHIINKNNSCPKVYLRRLKTLYIH